MKTSYSFEQIVHFSGQTGEARAGTVQQIEEGSNSQAVMFENHDGVSLVMRVSSERGGFAMDEYAEKKFGATLPIPKVLRIGNFDGQSYYCISERIFGVLSNKLSEEEMQPALPGVRRTLANLFNANISASTGYGGPKLPSGNASHSSWKDFLSICMHDFSIYRANASNLGLDPDFADRFMAQFQNNLQFASEERRLLHGDPGFDNMFVKDGHVAGIVDWAFMKYGDWMLDFAFLEFWWPGRHGDLPSFAEEFGLDAANLSQRKALYWAIHALWTISWASKSNSREERSWLREHLERRLI